MQLKVGQASRLPSQPWLIGLNKRFRTSSRRREAQRCYELFPRTAVRAGQARRLPYVGLHGSGLGACSTPAPSNPWFEASSGPHSQELFYSHTGFSVIRTGRQKENLRYSRAPPAGQTDSLEHLRQWNAVQAV